MRDTEFNSDNNKNSSCTITETIIEENSDGTCTIEQTTITVPGHDYPFFDTDSDLGG